MSHPARDEHWRQLRAERAAARAALVSSLDAIEARASDPLRLKERMRKHPVLFAGVAAGAGALLIKMIMGGRDPAPAPESRESESRARVDGPDLMETLRDAAVRAAAPWVTRFIVEHLEQRGGVDDVCATNGTETERPAN